MALPPEHIHIKRRRDEEPVDSLYIRTENQQKRRRFTEFIFQRIQDADGLGGPPTDTPKKRSSNAKSQRALSGYARAEVPTVRASLPGEEVSGGRHGGDTILQHRGLAQDVVTPRDSVTTSTGITQRSSSPNIPPSPAKARDLSIIPRRFHLKKSASATFPYASSPSGGIQKRKKGQKPDIAVFVERAKEGLKRQKSSLSTESIADSQALREATDISVPTTQIHTQTSQKRPNASAVEKQWRAQQWGQKALQRIPVDPPKSENFPESDARDHVSLQLAEELQQFALQHTNGDRPAEPIKPTSNLKYQPKVPAQRHRDTQLQSTAVADKDSEMEIVDDAEDEGEYVYDTYTRQPSKPDTVHYDLENMHLVSGLDEDNAKIGVLVITEEDQEIWEAYAEDDDSDKDWNSEEEDENAEDYHANDYPEEEVDSEDEYDRGAYNHRRNASDDEEYDEDTADWSDDGEDTLHPWKQSAWSSRAKGIVMSDDELSD